MNKIIITGGAGFIGTNVAHQLLANGYEVVIVDDLSGGKRDNVPAAATFHEFSILDTKALTEVCQGASHIIHLAALPRVQFSIQHPRETHEVNVTGTLSVLEAARTAGVKRVVYAASSSAYGDQETLPLSLDLSPQPKSPYALQKYIGEEYMRLWSTLFSIETVSLRFFNVYGPHLDPEGPYALVIGRFLKLASEGKPLTITGDGTQTRDFTHVSDVVAAIEGAAFSDAVGQGEVLNIGAGRQVSINEVAALIGGPIEYVEPRLEPKHTLADITKTFDLLGWTPKMRLEEGIAALKSDWNLV